MAARRWIGVGVVVAAAGAVAFLPGYGGKLVRQIRERIAEHSPGDKPNESQLLADVFNKVGDREPAYRPWRKGELQFHKQIAPIVYEKCARCHNTGGIAPFELTSFAEVRKRARRIRQVVGRSLMPPWRADRCSQEFVGDTSLTNQEKGMLEQWLAEGCREGDSSSAPLPPPPRPEWPNGTPDIVLQSPETYNVPAEGADFFRCFVIPTNNREDRYVRIASIAPGSKAVHHVLIYTDTSGVARRLDQAEDGPGYSAFGSPRFNPASNMGQWEPGVIDPPLPDGIGYFLPKGADVVLHVHYHPTGKEETDLSRVALYFCDKPVDKRLRCLPILIRPDVLRIGAGESDAVFWTEQEIPGDITVVQIFPHMHLVGREIAAAATLPEGTTVPIIRISNWDFRWQTLYMFKTPLRLPKGTRIRLEARFDNSAANPQNPNQPPKPVRFGLTTVDEMCILSLLYTVDSERLTQGQFASRFYPDTLFPPRRRWTASYRK